MFRKKKSSLRVKCDRTFDIMEKLALAVSYDDLLLLPAYSEILPKDAVLKTRFSRNVATNIPIVSSPMDTVTEMEMAVAMAYLGGLGIIHKNLSPEQQASQVGIVKHKLNAFISDPKCFNGNQSVQEVLAIAKRKNYDFRSFPVLNDAKDVIGIVSSSDFEFCKDATLNLSDIMSKDVVGAPKGTNVAKAYQILMDRKIKILPVFNRQRKLLGIYTLADVQRIVREKSLDFNLAPDGTLRVGAAIGVGEDAKQRMELLAAEGADVVVIDTAHGDSKSVIDMVGYCKKRYPHIDVVAGNISRGSAAKRLAKAGADGVRVGMGPGSICTTRIVTGAGRAQLTAVYECSKALRGSGIPVCADGGIEYSGHITKALAAGAATVMLGSLLAGTTESPGEVVFHQDRRTKVYRGMGSLGAMKDSRASRERYGQGENAEDKLVPEGVEGEVDFKGDVGPVVHQLVWGLRDGMGYTGARTIPILQATAEFDRITAGGLRESHPHGLARFEKTLNYAG